MTIHDIPAGVHAAAPALLSSCPFTSCPDLFRASISAAAMAPMEMPGTSPGMTEGAHPGMTEEPVPSLLKEGVPA